MNDRSRLLLVAVLITGATVLHGQARLNGVLEDERGQPLPYVDMQVCNSATCFFGQSEADGVFRFDLPDEPARYVIKTVEDATNTLRRGSVLAPIRVSGGSPLDVGRVYVPLLPREFALRGSAAQQTAQLGDGLELTLSRPDLIAPAGKTLVGLAARRIPVQRAPTYRLPGNEKIVAVFALSPLAVRSQSPIAVKVPSPLPAGTPVRFRTIDEIDGALSEPVSGYATGTHVATDAGKGITRLTHLLITAVSQ